MNNCKVWFKSSSSYLLVTSLVLLLLSNAVTSRRDKSILFSRIANIDLLYSSYLAYNDLDISFLEKGINLYGGLFHATWTTHIFHLFIFLLSANIISLTAFYNRKVWVDEYSSIYRILYIKFLLYKTKTKITNKMGKLKSIKEYPLTLLFIVTGFIFLVSTSDLISTFICLGLVSYGLYLIYTLY